MAGGECIENVFHARRYRVSIVASRENAGDVANAHVYVYVQLRGTTLL